MFNQINPAETNIQNELWRLKRRASDFVSSLPGEFTITTDGSIGSRFFAIETTNDDTGYKDTLVWDFDSDANEFTLLGF